MGEGGGWMNGKENDAWLWFEIRLGEKYTKKCV